MKKVVERAQNKANQYIIAAEKNNELLEKYQHLENENKSLERELKATQELNEHLHDELENLKRRV